MQELQVMFRVDRNLLGSPASHLRSAYSFVHPPLQQKLVHNLYFAYHVTDWSVLVGPRTGDECSPLSVDAEPNSVSILKHPIPVSISSS
jgi:hypothetical protein